MNLIRFSFCFLILISVAVDFLPSFAQSADEDCATFCTDQEKFPDKYKGGRLRPNGGTGDCNADTEVSEDICCCEKK